MQLLIQVKICDSSKGRIAFLSDSRTSFYRVRNSLNRNLYLITPSNKLWNILDEVKEVMKKKQITFFTIVVFIVVIGYIMAFPERLFPNLYPTYIETIESNWNLSLPIPDSENTIYNARDGSHGDGDAITELQYNDGTDIERIKGLSNDWVSGEEFKISEFPTWVQDLIKNIDNDASYFFLQDDGFDYIIFELKGNKLTIYESYI